LSRRLFKEKVGQCTKALADLKRYQKTGTEEYFRANPDIYYAVCYRFVSAIESLYDLSQVALANKGKYATGEENISIMLAREGIISDDLAKRFSSMYGFRNRLVHAYGTLDDAKVAEYLASRLSDIEELLALFQKMR
jgi:uncharacterized protein YutE (UPF0331/DUF86 family)